MSKDDNSPVQVSKQNVLDEAWKVGAPLRKNWGIGGQERSREQTAIEDSKKVIHSFCTQLNSLDKQALDEVFVVYRVLSANEQESKETTLSDDRLSKLNLVTSVPEDEANIRLDKIRDGRAQFLEACKNLPAEEREALILFFSQISSQKPEKALNLMNSIGIKIEENDVKLASELGAKIDQDKDKSKKEFFEKSLTGFASYSDDVKNDLLAVFDVLSEKDDKGIPLSEKIIIAKAKNLSIFANVPENLIASSLKEIANEKANLVSSCEDLTKEKRSSLIQFVAKTFDTDNENALKVIYSLGIKAHDKDKEIVKNLNDAEAKYEAEKNKKNNSGNEEERKFGSKKQRAIEQEKEKKFNDAATGQAVSEIAGVLVGTATGIAADFFKWMGEDWAMFAKFFASLDKAIGKIFKTIDQGLTKVQKENANPAQLELLNSQDKAKGKASPAPEKKGDSKSANTPERKGKADLEAANPDDYSDVSGKQVIPSQMHSGSAGKAGPDRGGIGR